MNEHSFSKAGRNATLGNKAERRRSGGENPHSNAHSNAHINAHSNTPKTLSSSLTSSNPIIKFDGSTGRYILHDLETTHDWFVLTEWVNRFLTENTNPAITTTILQKALTTTSSNQKTDDPLRVSIIQRIVSTHPQSSTITDKIGNTSLHIVLRNPGHISPLAQKEIVTGLIVANPRLLSLRDHMGQTPLHVACENADFPQEEIRMLFTMNPEASKVRDHRGNLPLHIACGRKKACPTLLKFLMDAYSVGLYLESNDGDTPLDIVRKSFKKNRNNHTPQYNSIIQMMQNKLRELPSGEKMKTRSGATEDDVFQRKNNMDDEDEGEDEHQAELLKFNKKLNMNMNMNTNPGMNMSIFSQKTNKVWQKKPSQQTQEVVEIDSSSDEDRPPLPSYKNIVQPKLKLNNKRTKPDGIINITIPPFKRTSICSSSSSSSTNSYIHPHNKSTSHRNKMLSTPPDQLKHKVNAQTKLNSDASLRVNSSSLSCASSGALNIPTIPILTKLPPKIPPKIPPQTTPVTTHGETKHPKLPDMMSDHPWSSMSSSSTSFAADPYALLAHHSHQPFSRNSFAASAKETSNNSNMNVEQQSKQANQPSFPSLFLEQHAGTGSLIDHTVIHHQIKLQHLQQRHASLIQNLCKKNEVQREKLKDAKSRAETLFSEFECTEELTENAQKKIEKIEKRKKEEERKKARRKQLDDLLMERLLKEKQRLEEEFRGMEIEHSEQKKQIFVDELQEREGNEKKDHEELLKKKKEYDLMINHLSEEHGEVLNEKNKKGEDMDGTRRREIMEVNNHMEELKEEHSRTQQKNNLELIDINEKQAQSILNIKSLNNNECLKQIDPLLKEKSKLKLVLDNYMSFFPLEPQIQEKPAETKTQKDASTPHPEHKTSTPISSLLPSISIPPDKKCHVRIDNDKHCSEPALRMIALLKRDIEEMEYVIDQLKASNENKSKDLKNQIENKLSKTLSSQSDSKLVVNDNLQTMVTTVPSHSHDGNDTQKTGRDNYIISPTLADKFNENTNTCEEEDSHVNVMDLSCSSPSYSSCSSLDSIDDDHIVKLCPSSSNSSTTATGHPEKEDIHVLFTDDQEMDGIENYEIIDGFWIMERREEKQEKSKGEGGNESSTTMSDDLPLA